MSSLSRSLSLAAALGGGLFAPPAFAHKTMCGVTPGIPPTYSFGEPGDFAEFTRKVTITMFDMSFKPTELKVKRGESIRFVLTNDSPIDHDFTLGDEATQIQHRREMAIQTDLVAAHRVHRDAHTMFVPAGETRVLIWTFSRPGVFEYDCNIPGHFEAGMRGQIRVE